METCIDSDKLSLRKIKTKLLSYEVKRDIYNESKRVFALSNSVSDTLSFAEGLIIEELPESMAEARRVATEAITAVLLLESLT